MANQGSIMKLYAIRPKEREQSRKRTHDDLVVPEDAELHYREVVTDSAEAVTFNSYSRTKSKGSDSGGSQKVNSHDNSGNSSTGHGSGGQYDRRYLSRQDEIILPEKLDLNLIEDQKRLFSGSRKVLLTANQSANQKLKAELPPKAQSQSELLAMAPEPVVIPKKEPSPSPNFDPIPQLSCLNPVVMSRLSLELPKSSVEADVAQIESTLKSIDSSTIRLTKTLNETENLLIDIQQSSRNIKGKAATVSQTAQFVDSRLDVMDDWIDEIQSAGWSIKTKAIEWVVKFVTFLSSLFLIVWNTLKKPFTKSPNNTERPLNKPEKND